MDTIKKTHRLDQDTAKELKEIAGEHMTENKAVIMVINQHHVMKSEIKKLRRELFEAADKYVTVRDELSEVKKTWKKLFKLVK